MRNKFDVDEDLTSEFNTEHLKRAYTFMLPYKKQLLITLLLMVISSIMTISAPYILKIALDDAIPNKNIWQIVALSLMLAATVACSTLILRYRIITMANVGEGIIHDMRLALFKHLQKLPFAYYDSRPHGKILVRVVNYINSLSDLLSNGFVNLLVDTFSLVTIVIIMLVLDLRLALVSLSGMPILFIIVMLLKTKQKASWRRLSAKQSNLNAYLHESISGLKITQAFTREDMNYSIFNKLSTQVRERWMKAVKLSFLLWPSADNIMTITNSFLYVVGVSLIVNHQSLTVGVLVAFTGYIGRFWQPINNIANFYNALINNMAYLERIFETMDEPVLVKDCKDAKKMPQIKGDIIFDNVTFAYDENAVILKDLSFTASAGDTIALVGPTGAGKTTVINLLSRFYDLSGGKILIDGNDISKVTLHSLRSQMGIMLQDSFIFSGTIMDNIRYAKLKATDEEVIAAAKTVCAHDFIIQMENGYLTEVNERGSRLSAGERQLISFARALLADPKILILDEATSSIDTKTELALQEGLERLLKGRTSFIIAHRLSTIKNASKIMYIDNKTIQESGLHDELIKKQGYYYRLHKSQYAFLAEL